MQSAAIEHLHGHFEALAFIAKPVLKRYFHIIEVHVANVGALLAHFLLGLANRDALEIARDQESADARAALLVGIGARHHREERSSVGVGDVALGASEVIVIANALGLGAHGSGI